MMTEPLSPTASSKEQDLRTFALIAHGCMAGSWVIFGIPVLVAGIIAYLKRADAIGTPWERHFRAIRRDYWIGIAAGLIGFLTAVVFVGIIILVVAGIYLLVRGIIGIIKAINRKSL